MKKILLAFLLVLSMPVFAETTGVINLANVSVSVTTGLTGYTVNLCNLTADCRGHLCFNDYDSVSSPGSTGWCNSSVVTSCYHNNSERATGTVICLSNVTYSTCATGNWSSASTCGSGNTCASTAGEPGNCTSSSSSTTTSGGGSTSIYNPRNASMIFVSSPTNFDIVQGNSVVTYISLKNNGNLTLYNITLGVSGFSWYSIDPAKVNRTNTGISSEFTINFSAPEDAEVKAYSVTITANTNNASIHPSSSFTINLKPSNKTVQEQILPSYGVYVNNLAALELNVTLLEQNGFDVAELKGLVLIAKRNLQEANRSIEAGEYFEAQQSLNAARDNIDVILSKLAAPQNPVSGDFTFIIILVVIVVAVAAFVGYLLLPPKKTTSGVVKGWISSDKKEGVLWRLRKKKDDNR